MKGLTVTLILIWVVMGVVSGRDPRTIPKKKKGSTTKKSSPPPPNIQTTSKSIEDEIKRRESTQKPVIAQEGSEEESSGKTESLIDRLKHLLSSALQRNQSVYLRLIDLIDGRTAPLLTLAKEKAAIGALLFALLVTFVFLKVVGRLLGIGRGKTTRGTSAAVDSAAIDQLSTVLTGQLETIKGDLEKLVGGLTGKVTDLQKHIEKMSSEKRDEDQLEFLFGNLGDLWKEIRDLKTRINEVDGGGSNLLSFNSKMEFKGLGGKDKGGLDDDDDSTSRKNAAQEPGNRILPKELSGQPVAVPPREEAKVTPAEKPSLPQWRSPAKPLDVQAATSRLEISPVSTKPTPRGHAPIPLPSQPSGTEVDEVGTPRDNEGTPLDGPERRHSRPETLSSGTTLPPFQPEDDTPHRSEADPPAEFKPLSIQPRLPMPMGLPKTQKKGPQMHRALPPKAPGTPNPTPTPKPADSSNLI